MKNSLILDKIMQRYRALVLPFPIFPFPSLPYLPTFHRFCTFPFSSFPFPIYPTFILPSTSLPCPFRIYQYSSFLLNLPNFLLIFPFSIFSFLSQPSPSLLFLFPTNRFPNLFSSLLFPLPHASFFSDVTLLLLTFFFPHFFSVSPFLFPPFLFPFPSPSFFHSYFLPFPLDFFPPGKKNFTPLVAGRV